MAFSSRSADHTSHLGLPDMQTPALSASIELSIVQMLCSRLCHDLAGPAGAVGAGVDLLGEAAAGPDPEALDLVVFGARQLSSRLSYYRVAFGSGGTAANLSWPGVRSLAESLFEGSRVDLVWSQPTQAATKSLPSDIYRLATLLILVGSEALPRGGTLALTAAPVHAGCLLSLSVSGASVVLNKDVATALRGEGNDLVTSRTVTAFYAARLAKTLGATIDIEALDGSMELRVALPAFPAEH